MANLTLEITGLDATIKGLGGLPQKGIDAAWAGIQRTAFQALDEARREVPKDTTTLLRSITLDFDQSSLLARLFTNLEYSAMIEYGFTGIVPVFPHTRLQTHAWGKPIPAKVVAVDGHFRRVDREAQPYMRPAFKVVEERLDVNVAKELDQVRL